ncbi:MAG TPA: Fic family protein [Puia sp.]|nr:Fic family protein [Puia sp.]
MAAKKTHISRQITVFHGRTAPEEGLLVGYGAMIESLQLAMPMPDVLCIISKKNRQYVLKEWKVLTPRHQPEDTLYKQLVFALKYEGINLLFFKKLFTTLKEKDVLDLIRQEPTSQYSRRLWFLYEWLLSRELKISNADSRITYVLLADEKLQYVVDGMPSTRHRIINNLPGTPNFCPVIRKTPVLEELIAKNLSTKQTTYLKSIHKDVLQRASAFLLLKDSKASFTIEGESPKSRRAVRWGQAIGQAGKNDLSADEFNRLQQLVIENTRFIEMGFRKKGGFVGEHDRTTGEPIPDHISARWQDLGALMIGLIETNQLLLKAEFDAVLAATSIAFGFVFIHPFEDGNGRIHRYLIHHVLARKKFSQQGIIFPVSASILDRIDEYRMVLESYSKPLLQFIDWKETPDHNIEVLNETIDYYRYFDATSQAEFLYSCVEDTILNIIPKEVEYLIRYDAFKRFLDDEFEMPDKMVALLVRFLNQNNGVLSKRLREKEFSQLNESEIKSVESKYKELFEIQQ